MFNKIAGYSVLIVTILLIIGAIGHDNEARTFRANVATCNDVMKKMGSDIPTDAAAFCKTINDEVADRQARNDEINIQYLERRGQEMRTEQ